ncbi:hypothetical protein ACQEU6_15815 [Spirillospora sp. CA-108201]
MAINFNKAPNANLTKNDEAVGVALDDKAGSVITAELTWQSGVAGGSDLDLFGWVVGKSGVAVPRQRGLFNRLAKADAVGTAEVVYHHNLGSLQDRPHMQHTGDSRVPGSEVMRLGNLSEQGYALFGVYQAYGNGVGSLKSFGAKVTVTDTEGNQTTVPLVQDHPNRYWASIVLVDCTDPRGYVVRKVEDYSRPGIERSPVLYADGSFKMNEGPEYLTK